MIWVGIAIGVVIGFVAFTAMAYAFLNSTSRKTDELTDVQQRRHEEAININADCRDLLRRKTVAVEAIRDMMTTDRVRGK